VVAREQLSAPQHVLVAEIDEDEIAICTG